MAQAAVGRDGRRLGGTGTRRKTWDGWEAVEGTGSGWMRWEAVRGTGSGGMRLETVEERPITCYSLTPLFSP